MSKDLRKLRAIHGKLPFLRPVVSMIMRASGLTYREIGDVTGVTRQRAERVVKDAEKSFEIK